MRDGTATGFFRLASVESGGWQWELVSRLMGQTIATSPRFADRDAALKAIKWLRTSAARCPIVDADGQPFSW